MLPAKSKTHRIRKAHLPRASLRTRPATPTPIKATTTSALNQHPNQPRIKQLLATIPPIQLLVSTIQMQSTEMPVLRICMQMLPTVTQMPIMATQALLTSNRQLNLRAQSLLSMVQTRPRKMSFTSHRGERQIIKIWVKP